MKWRCKAKPEPVVTWYRENTIVKESTKIFIKSSTTEEDLYELLLEIKVILIFELHLYAFYLALFTIHAYYM